MNKFKICFYAIAISTMLIACNSKNSNTSSVDTSNNTEVKAASVSDNDAHNTSAEAELQQASEAVANASATDMSEKSEMATMAEKQVDKLKEMAQSAEETKASAIEKVNNTVADAKDKMDSKMIEASNKVESVEKSAEYKVETVAAASAERATGTKATAVDKAEAKVEKVKATATEVKTAPAPVKEAAPAAAPAAADMHKDWNSILSTYVSASGKVNYAGIKGEKNRLEGYLAVLSNNPPQGDWSRSKKLAYWINAYNAHTVKFIVDNYPVNSIKDLAGGKPWDKKWIKIGGKTYSLNNIENDIIRPKFNEPRIHFAVNCAAKSCPPLLNEAWTAKKLESQFEKTTKKFINNSAHNTFSGGTATVSKIFDWYGVDFGDLKAFLSKYSGQNVTTIQYNDYDWTLNN